MNINYTTSITLFLILALQGCISITVDHTLHPDGSSDIAYTLESEAPFLLNGLQESFESTFVVENAELSETNTSFTYTFKNVYPDAEGVLGDNRTSVQWETQNGFFSNTYTVRMNGSGNTLTLGEEMPSNTNVTEALDSVELNYDIKPFGTVVDTNGQRMDTGEIRFDLTEQKEYFITFKKNKPSLWLASTFSSSEPPEWETTDWSSCQNGTQTRTVTLQNEANYMMKPPTTQSC